MNTEVNDRQQFGFPSYFICLVQSWLNSIVSSWYKVMGRKERIAKFGFFKVRKKTKNLGFVIKDLIM